MKKGTAARIAIYGLSLVVMLGILIPIVTAVTSEEAQVGIGIPSVYDLEESNTDTVTANIDLAVNGETGYELAYGDERVAVDPADIEKASKAAMASGAATATLYGPDGKTATQQVIYYGNSVYQTTVTGVMVPGIEDMPMDLRICTSVTSPEGDVVFRGNSETSITDQGIVMTVQLPMIPLIAALAAGYDQSLEATGGMKDIFEMEMTLVTDNTEPIPYTVTSVAGITTVAFDTSLAGNDVGSIGDIAVTSNTLTSTLTLTCAGDVSDRLREQAEAGPVEIKMSSQSYIMSSEDALGLAGIFEVLEAAA